jgi:predicted nucleic acid-binding protein
MSGEFLDSNILVYAQDKSAGKKREIAVNLVLRLLEEGNGLLSVQVLMEFFVNVTRKIPKPIPTDEAAEIIHDFATWKTFSPGPHDVLEAIRIAKENRINFWDAAIVRASAAQEAKVIWSEDLNHGQVYEGVTVKNPFR